MLRFWCFGGAFVLFRGAARVGVGVAIVVSISSMVHIDNGNGFGVLGWRSVCLSL